MNTNTQIYQDISVRTSGDIYIGVVGPVRAGKSTFIKRFMETQVIPNIDNVYRRERAKDELPQSGSGRTVMTAEPKFVPEEAVDIALDEGGSCSVRLIDCVGYMIPGATGTMEGENPRMVTTPWLDHEVTMSEAAELGTSRVIREHSTIGIVITTDGSITDIPREAYVEAEGRVIRELQEIGKPFLVLLNAEDPQSARVQAIAKDISERYGVTCLPVNCLLLDDAAVADILQAILYEFPVSELDLFLPPWVEALDHGHPIKCGLYQAIREGSSGLHCIREIAPAIAAMGAYEGISAAKTRSIDLGTGIAQAELQLPRSLFYQTLSQQSGFDVKDDGDLMSLLTQLSSVKAEYDKVAQAVADARDTGYGIVVPSVDELNLEEPEIMKQGGRYGVKLKASAPSIHIGSIKQKLRGNQPSKRAYISCRNGFYDEKTAVGQLNRSKYMEFPPDGHFCLFHQGDSFFAVFTVIFLALLPNQKFYGTQL